MSRAALLVGLSGVWVAPTGATSAPPPAVHTQLESSVPAAGDTVNLAPDELLLTFGGLVEEAGTAFRLLGPSGHSWSLEGARVPGSARALTSPLPELSRGAYRLEWRVISGDGHPISGDFVFFVRGSGTAAGGAGELGPPPPPSAERPAGESRQAPEGGMRATVALMGTRSAANIAVMLLAGLLLFASLGGAAPSTRTRWVTQALAVAAPVLVAGYAWVWAGSVLGSRSAAAERLDALARLFTGRALTAELAFAVLVPWALFLARRPRVAALAAMSAVAAGAFAGHPASYTPAISIPSSALHQLAAATWLGGLLYLLTESGSASFATSARRVSDAALAAVAAVAVTGLVQSWMLLDTLAQLFSTPYGLLLLGKVAGLAGLLAFGAHHRFRLMPRIREAGGPSRLSLSVRAELTVAVGVLTLAAVMSHVPPNP